MCIVVRTDKQLKLYADYLREKNIKTYKLKRSAYEDREFDGIICIELKVLSFIMYS